MQVRGKVWSAVVAVMVTSIVTAWAPDAEAQDGQPDPCADVGGPVEPTSPEQVEELLVGTWILCDGAPLLGDAMVGEVGLQLTADGHFHRVFATPDGGLLRTEGMDQEGEWWARSAERTPPDADVYVVELDALAGRFRWGIVDQLTPSSVTFLGGARYGAWTGPEPTPGIPDAFADQPCGVPTDPVVTTSTAETAELLVGTWIRCDGSSPLYGSPGGDVGLELLADGRFHLVFEDPDGRLVTGDGTGREGTWTVTDEPNPEALELTLLGYATAPRSIHLFATPDFLRLQRQVSTFYDHVRWTGAPPVPAGGAPSTTAPVPTTGAPTTTVTTGDAGAEVLGRTATLPRTGTSVLVLVASAALLTAAGLVVLSAARPVVVDGRRDRPRGQAASSRGTAGRPR